MLDKVNQEAQFLKTWSKGKQLTKAPFGKRTWNCGRQSTMIDPETVEAMIKQGLAVRNSTTSITIK